MKAKQIRRMVKRTHTTVRGIIKTVKRVQISSADRQKAAGGDVDVRGSGGGKGG